MALTFYHEQSSLRNLLDVDLYDTNNNFYHTY